MQSITSLLPTALRRVLPFGAAAVLFSMFSLQAKADLCVTQYSGCTSCSWSGSVWVPGTYPDFNGHYEVQSGFDSYCEYGSATPWVSGGATASSQGNFCGATGPLPNAEQVWYVEAPTQPSGNVQFAYRYYNSGARQHFYTVTQSEKPWGWTYEGVGFKTLVTPIDGNMTQLYRCIVVLTL
jgi:hypothetical protein